MRDESTIETVNPDEVFAHELKSLEEHKHLIDQIQIVIPCRPADGMCFELEEQVCRWTAMGFNVRFLKDFMGGFIEVVRANMSLQFLKGSDRKFLMMIDSDVVPPLDLPVLLARHDKPMVGSPVPITLKDHGPTLNFTVGDAAGNWRFPSFVNHPKIPAYGLMEVAHIGTGCVMIRRDVLEAFTWEGEDVPFMVPGELRAEGLRTGNLRRGEDIEFCSQVRRKGFTIYADMGACSGHRKTLTLTVPDELRDPTMNAAEWVTKETEYLVGEY